jgi:hypothetical protein
MTKGPSSVQDKVPSILDWLGSLPEKYPRLLERLARMETTFLAPDLEKTQICKPVFICGLARSGSTVLLELIAGRSGFAAHQYRDYPFLLTPVFWDTIRKFWPGFDTGEITERAHKDRIMVSSRSPEAFEEMVWMHYFPHLHTPRNLSVLDETTSAPDFERDFPDHVRKILLLRKGDRYVSKNNYNLTRIGFLSRMFPDATFVIPVREPIAHIASLLKQHRLFSIAQKQDPASLRYMQRCGHFEFGLDFRPIDTGDGTADEVTSLWNKGHHAEAYGIYWASLHKWTIQLREKHGTRVQIVPYEDLCQHPQTVLTKLSNQLDLGMTDADIASWSSRLSLPSYYRPDFSGEELHRLQDITAKTYTDVLEASA